MSLKNLQEVSKQLSVAKSFAKGEPKFELIVRGYKGEFLRAINKVEVQKNISNHTDINSLTTYRSQVWFGLLLTRK